MWSGIKLFDIYSKSVWVVSLKDAKDTTTVNAFQKILDELGYKPNNLWVDKESDITIN